MISQHVRLKAAGHYSSRLIVASARNILLALDVDKNGTFDAGTDAVMLLRYLFRFKGSSITDNAIGGAAQRATVPLITEYLDYVRPQLGIDGKASSVLADGLLILRCVVRR